MGRGGRGATAFRLTFPLPPFLPLWNGIGTSGFALAAAAGTLCGWLLARRALARAALHGQAAFARPDLERLRARAPLLLFAAWLGARGGALLLRGDWDWSLPFTWIGLATASLSYDGAILGLAAGWVLAAFAEERVAGAPPFLADLRATLAVADALAGPAACALAIGWLGLPGYGTLTSLPWAIALPGGLAAHPVQLYGALGYAALAFLFGRSRSARARPGETAFAFLAVSSALRLLLGFFQSDPLLTARPLALTVGQWADAALLILTLAAWLGLARGRQPERRAEPAARVLAVLLLASAFLAFLGRGPAAAGVAPGFSAPDFTLRTLDGRDWSPALARGAPLVLDFWASWCPPCRKELPILDAFAAELGSRGRVVAVDVAEDPQTVQAFVRETGLALPILLDRQGAVRELYGVRALPTTVFLDARGVVTSVVVGPLTRSSLERHWQAAGGSGSP